MFSYNEDFFSRCFKNHYPWVVGLQKIQYIFSFFHPPSTKPSTMNRCYIYSENGKQYLQIPQNITEQNFNFAAYRSTFYHELYDCANTNRLRWIKCRVTAVEIRQRKLNSFGKGKSCLQSAWVSVLSQWSVKADNYNL